MTILIGANFGATKLIEHLVTVHGLLHTEVPVGGAVASRGTPRSAALLQWDRRRRGQL